MARVLVIGEIPLTPMAISRESIADYLRGVGFVVEEVGSIVAATSTYADHPPDAVLMTLCTRATNDGLKLLDWMSLRPGPVPVLVVDETVCYEATSRSLNQYGFVRGRFEPCALDASLQPLLNLFRDLGITPVRKPVIGDPADKNKSFKGVDMTEATGGANGHSPPVGPEGGAFNSTGTPEEPKIGGGNGSNPPVGAVRSVCVVFCLLGALYLLQQMLGAAPDDKRWPLIALVGCFIILCGTIAAFESVAEPAAKLLERIIASVFGKGKR